MSKTATLALRVKPELKEKLIQLAENDKRSINTTCEIGLEDHIMKRGYDDDKLMEITTEANMETISNFMKHYKNETGKQIPEKVFLSFFNA